MIKKFAHVLAILAMISTLVLSLFVVQQAQQIKRLSEEIEAQSSATVMPNESRDLLAYQRDTDAKILEIEGQLGVLRRKLKGAPSGIHQENEGDVFAPDAPGVKLSANEQSAIRAALQDPDDPLRQQLRDVFREENSRIRDERDEQRLVRRMEEIEQGFEEFATKHALTQAQRDVVLPQLKSEQTQLNALRQARREGDMDRQEIRAQFNAIRAETDTFIAGELDATQLDAYTKTREEERGRGGRGGGGRRGRD